MCLSAGTPAATRSAPSRDAAAAYGPIVANTAQVQSFVRRLVQKGVSIPDDLSVIVFDDNPWTELMSPPLSVIRQPLDMLAVHALELVLGRMQGKFLEGPRLIEVKADFLPRQTARPTRPRPHPYPLRKPMPVVVTAMFTPKEGSFDEVVAALSPAIAEVHEEPRTSSTPSTRPPRARSS